MNDRPILFSAPMVRALLDGRKTQTRRIIKMAGIGSVAAFERVARDPHGRPVYEMRDGAGKHYARPAAPGFIDYHYSTPIGFRDRLWVRETWQALTFGDYQPTKSSQSEVRFAATDPCADLDVQARGYPWRPSIFMPRWASRLTLIVTDVRVERLQACSDKDALAEGVEGTISPVAGRDVDIDGFYWPGGPQRMYRELWERINGPRAWDANHWVAAYTFTVHPCNIDQMEAIHG